MNTEVKFTRVMNFTGRNGYMKQSGVDIQTAAHDEKVIISPITSRGYVGRCDMEIPYENLPSFIGELKEAFIQLTAERKAQKQKA